MRAIDDINQKLYEVEKTKNTKNETLPIYDIHLSELFNKALSSSYDFKNIFLKLCQNDKKNNIYDFDSGTKYCLFSNIGNFAQEHYICGFLIGFLNDELEKPYKKAWQNELDCFVFLRDGKCIFNSAIEKHDDQLRGYTINSIKLDDKIYLNDLQHCIPMGSNIYYASGNLDFVMSNDIANALKNKLENAIKKQGFDSSHVGIYNVSEKVCHIKSNWISNKKIVPINSTQKIIFFEIEW